MTMDPLTLLASSYDNDDGHDDAFVPPAGIVARTSNTGAEEKFAFGDFQLIPRSRLLLRKGRPVCLGSRAFDLLHALLKSAGQLVCKEALVKEVWPSTFVDESNLRFQMTCLRKALGEERHYITTVPGRGYIFTGECCRVDPPSLGPEVPYSSSLQATANTRSPAQLSPFTIGSTEQDGGPHGHPHAMGRWHLASVTIVQASSAPQIEAGESPTCAAPALDDAEAPRIELLLPLLIVSNHPDADTSDERARGLATVNLASLLDLLRSALCARRG
jgi:DNA-binding winged helix-turn-helix (wHTH) protein